MDGMKIAASTSLKEKCLKGGYQDQGTQSKHLTQMHTLALGVFWSDESWQRFLCLDYLCVCDPQLYHSFKLPTPYNLKQNTYIENIFLPE